MPIAAQHLKAARLHLQKSDPVMKRIIKRVGPCTIKLKKDHFQSLIWTIVGQQVSAAGAKTVFERLRKAVPDPVIRPESIQQLGVEGIRELGITRPKASYMMNLAESVTSNRLSLKSLGRKSDQQIMDALVSVKGIGEWTAQIFLIFSLGRLDVYPKGDLAIRSAIQKNYELDSMPDEEALNSIGQSWEPYRSIACWYLWETIHLDRAQK